MITAVAPAFPYIRHIAAVPGQCDAFTGETTVTCNDAPQITNYNCRNCPPANMQFGHSYRHVTSPKPVQPISGIGEQDTPAGQQVADTLFDPLLAGSTLPWRRVRMPRQRHDHWLSIEIVFPSYG